MCWDKALSEFVGMGGHVLLGLGCQDKLSQEGFHIYDKDWYWLLCVKVAEVPQSSFVSLLSGGDRFSRKNMLDLHLYGSLVGVILVKGVTTNVEFQSACARFWKLEILKKRMLMSVACRTWFWITEGKCWKRWDTVKELFLFLNNVLKGSDYLIYKNY